MLTSLQVVTPPAIEPLTLDRVRLHCRVDHQGDDVLLGDYLTAARAMAEMYLSRVLITQTLLWTMVPQGLLHPEWRNVLHGQVTLPRAPVQSIGSVVATDMLGNVTSISAAALPIAWQTPLSGYIADLALSPARLRIGGSTLLSGGLRLDRTPLQHLQVTFTAGYGADGTTVPKPILNAILLTVAHLYENRGDTSAELPRSAEWLLDPYRIMFMA